jgi:hypothetical protein
MRLLASALLIVLLAAGGIQHALAHLGIIWRASVVSWDNPATQWQDETASQTPPYVDPAAEATDAVRPAGRPKRAVLPARDRDRLAGDFASAITRAPPTP